MFRSLNKRKELGGVVGEKVSPLLSKEISSEDNVCDDKLKSFIVSVVLCGILDLLRPPLHPRLCIFFFDVVSDMGLSLKKEKQK